ncbi:MAG: hypothetical protein WCV41_02510 [Patescibacteria group bacterium]
MATATKNIEFVDFHGVKAASVNFNSICKYWDINTYKAIDLLITVAREILSQTQSLAEYIVFDMSNLEYHPKGDPLVAMEDIKTILKDRGGDLLICNVPSHCQPSYNFPNVIFYNSIEEALAVADDITK